MSCIIKSYVCVQNIYIHTYKLVQHTFRAILQNCNFPQKPPLASNDTIKDIWLVIYNTSAKCALPVCRENAGFLGGGGLDFHLCLYVLNLGNGKTFSGAVSILKKCLLCNVFTLRGLLLASSEFSLAWRQPEEYEKGLKSEYWAPWFLDGQELVIS